MSNGIIIAAAAVVSILVGLLWSLARMAKSDDPDYFSHLDLYQYIDRQDPSLSASLSNMLIRDAYAKLASELMLDPPIGDNEPLSRVRERLYKRAQEIYD